MEPMDESTESLPNNQNDIVAIGDVRKLLAHFSKTTYRPKDNDQFGSEVLHKSLELFKSDYNLITMNNLNGEMSSHYPSQMPLLMNERENSLIQRTNNTIYESFIDETRFRELAMKARRARCRARFPVPVILYKGKYVCRSATLSGGAEIYGRSSYDYLFNYSETCDNYNVSDSDNGDSPSEWPLFSKVRSYDIKLLKSINIGTIIDFMVEKKKVKFGMNVTSSEKVDKENRYSEFSLISLPYPGCEFFKNYRDNNYIAEGLIFDWQQAFVDATVSVPNDPIVNQLRIEWSNYKTWDLRTITKNYLKLIIRYLHEGNSGLLVHCISGWDRTPLFISLLRLSLWADGAVHQSLDAQQILYLTVAYDWMLFGHHLNDRLAKGEEIFFFCFNLLKEIVSDEFSINQGRNKSKSDRSDKAMNQTEAEQMLDAFIVENDVISSTDGDSSECSLSNKYQEQPTMCFNSNFSDDVISISSQNNGNLSEHSSHKSAKSPKSSKSPPSKRTSPVSVPGSKSRQRHDSSSSFSTGSWAMITGTGSIRESSETSGSVSCLNANLDLPIHESSNTLVDDETEPYQTDEGDRTAKLLKVRQLFFTSYHSTIGFNYNGDMKIGGLIGNITGMLSSRP